MKKKLAMSLRHTLGHALLAPGFHPLEHTSLVESGVGLAVAGEALGRRVHDQDHVQVAADTRRKVREQRPAEAVLRGLVAERRQEGLEFFRTVQAWDLPRAQQTVHHFQERRLHQLVVLQQKGHLLALYTRQLHRLETSRIKRVSSCVD